MDTVHQILVSCQPSECKYLGRCRLDKLTGIYLYSSFPGFKALKKKTFHQPIHTRSYTEGRGYRAACPRPVTEQHLHTVSTATAGMWCSRKTPAPTHIRYDCPLYIHLLLSTHRLAIKMASVPTGEHLSDCASIQHCLNGASAG